MADSPTTRTLRHLRKNGWTAAVVEKWNHHSKVRVDLFGFADIFAFKGEQVALVQCTTQSNRANREAKIRENLTAQQWRQGERNLILVYGWRQLVQYRKDGSKAKRKKWEPTITEL